MQRITWYALLAVVALVVPVGGQTPSQQQQMPRASVREIASIQGERFNSWVLLPDGRTLIYSSTTTRNASSWQPRATDTTFAYDIATKRRTLLGTNMLPTDVSPMGDRLAFTRTLEDGTGRVVWTMPIDPRTGLATGPAQRVSLRSDDVWPRFSPDGRTIAFVSFDGTLRNLIVVPAAGGSERAVATYPSSISWAWSTDGTYLYVSRNNNDSETRVERVPVAGGRSEPLVPRTDGEFLGLSPDARVALFHNWPDRFFYRTASGVEGEISVPLPKYDGGRVFNFALDWKLRYTMHTSVVRPGAPHVETIYEIDFAPALQAMMKR
jgi:dipeptidyl aminopeptidase/acylaminoacyl peptidase